MKTKTLVLACLSALTGCSSTPQYDDRLGDSLREVRVAMRVHPNGTVVDDQVAGIDGQAAREAMNRYYDTFKAPPPVVNVINIGGMTSGK